MKLKRKGERYSINTRSRRQYDPAVIARGLHEMETPDTQFAPSKLVYMPPMRIDMTAPIMY